ncbi:MAG TPA: hypothetical protein ENI95_11810 [Chloroflexi bacterium]|nr:hypothetical protein [Chloroflexota bacterium]
MNRRTVVLLVGLLIIALAAMGVGYGLWFEDLFVWGTVTTGTLDVAFSGPYIDEWFADENGAVLATDEGGIPPLDIPETDLGLFQIKHDTVYCDAWLEGPDGDSNVDEGADQLLIEVGGAYPSYHCLVTFDVTNIGSVPVHLEGPVSAPWNPEWVELAECFVPGQEEEIVQLHEGESAYCSVLIHFTNDSGVEENATYEFAFAIRAYQWNESPGAAPGWPPGGETTLDYGNVALSGGFESGNFDEVWDLTACDMEIRATLDMTGMVDDFGGDAHAWGEFGIRAVGYGNFNPTWMSDGAGVWITTDYDWTLNTFDPDPPGSPTLDLDDKLILQRGGGWDESYYNLPSSPPNPWANHGIWYDRDGVDPWQAVMWGAVDGGTYNTGGLYDVVLSLHANSATEGTAYLTINGVQQGFYDPGWHDGPPELYPAGMTFTGDMTQMQVFYGLYGYGATHTLGLNGITVTGCLPWN